MAATPPHATAPFSCQEGPALPSITLSREELLRELDHRGDRGVIVADLVQRFRLSERVIEEQIRRLHDTRLIEISTPARYRITDRGRRRLAYYESGHRSPAPP